MTRHLTFASFHSYIAPLARYADDSVLGKNVCFLFIISFFALFVLSVLLIT